MEGNIGGKVYNHIIIISDREIDNDSESNYCIDNTNMPAPGLSNEGLCCSRSLFLVHS